MLSVDRLDVLGRGRLRSAVLILRARRRGRDVAGGEPYLLDMIKLIREWSEREGLFEICLEDTRSRAAGFPRAMSRALHLRMLWNVILPSLKIARLWSKMSSMSRSPRLLMLVLPQAVWCAFASPPSIMGRFEDAAKEQSACSESGNSEVL